MTDNRQEDEDFKFISREGKNAFPEAKDWLDMDRENQAQSINSLLEEAMRLVQAAMTLGDKKGGLPNVVAMPPTAPARRGAQEPRQTIAVYWAGCKGLAALAEKLGGRSASIGGPAEAKARVDKIGTTSDPDLSRRLVVLGHDNYGAWHRRAGGLVKEPGFERWIAQAIGTNRSSVDPAISVKTRTIDVRLPPGLTRRGFDGLLGERLAAWSLARHYPDNARFTTYSIGVDRISRAGELYHGLDPLRDGDLLLGIVEDILTEFRATKRQSRAHRKVFAGERAQACSVPSRRSLERKKHPLTVAAKRAMIARRKAWQG